MTVIFFGGMNMTWLPHPVRVVEDIGLQAGLVGGLSVLGIMSVKWKDS